MNKTEFAQAWNAVSTEVSSTFANLAPDEYSAQQIGWSYAQNLDHLVRSTSAIANALGLPKILIRALFGTATQSRTSEQVRTEYLGKLSQGSQAGKKFTPTGTQTQDHLLGQWERVSSKLLSNLSGWNEQQLDTLRLPHPILGKLTIREMLFFTEFHTRHHLDNCARKRSQGE